MLTVVLADDHAVVAQGLGALLRDKLTPLRNMHDGRALPAAAAELNHNVVVTDISMHFLNGLKAIDQIRARPGANIVILTVHIGPDSPEQAFRTSASGYLLNDLISVFLEAKNDSRAAREILQ